MAGLGIHVTAILPGVYRSDWNGRSQRRVENRIPDYADLFATPPDLRWGDPAALGRVVTEAIEMPVPPEHLLVGPTAIAGVRQRLAAWLDEIGRWEALSEAGGEG